MAHMPDVDPWCNDDAPPYDMDEPVRLTLELPAGLPDEVLAHLHGLLESLTAEISERCARPLQRAWRARRREADLLYHSRTYVANQLSFPFMDDELLGAPF
jgi:hypothetical protein